MNPILLNLIAHFRQAQDRALGLLDSAGIRRPETAMDWSMMNYDEFSRKVSDITNHTFYKHGYGLEVNGPNWHIDFDFGIEGQTDEFDAWRLHIHSEESTDLIEYKQFNIQGLLDEALQEGYIVKRVYQYALNQPNKALEEIGTG